MTVTRTQKTLIVAGAACLGALALLFMMYDRISLSREQLEDVRVSREEAARIDQGRDAVERIYTETEAARSQLDSYLLSVQDPTGFLDLCEDLATDVGVSLLVDSISDEDTGTQERIRFVRAVFEVEGSWNALYALLAALENLPYAARLDHVSVQESDAGSGSRWSGQIHLRVASE